MAQSEKLTESRVQNFEFEVEKNLFLSSQSSIRRRLEP